LVSLLSLLVATSLGSFNVSIFDYLLQTSSILENKVLEQIRLPRVLLAGIVGASLGISGASLQGLFRNPLADPGLIGVSAGAALGASVVIVLGSSFIPDYIFGPFILPLSAIMGAALVIYLLYLFTKGFGYQGVTYMLLVGIAVNALASVGIGILTFISSDSELRGLTFWTMGSFGAANWTLVLPAIIVILITIFLLIPYSRQLDLLQLGEPEAYRLGVDVKSLKFRVIISSAIVVGISVSLSGMIGFVGLVVPHLMRLLGGVNHNYLLPASALFGATIMIVADLLSRTLIQPAELPVGLLTSAIGAPFFLWLIFRIRKT
jgi:iron complex transport system permease protein|tara:strand:+ start:1894 stop:2853 length:960 start_codon:yes stop_codon:yes gene_type:complete